MWASIVLSAYIVGRSLTIMSKLVSIVSIQVDALHIFTTPFHSRVDVPVLPNERVLLVMLIEVTDVGHTVNINSRYENYSCVLNQSLIFLVSMFEAMQYRQHLIDYL